MPDANDIIAARDATLDALSDSERAILNAIAATTTPGPYLTRLTDRRNDLAKERQAVIDAANVVVLSDAGVVAAVQNLTEIAKNATGAAKALPDATDKLTQAGKVLGFAQQFTDFIAGLSKS